VTHTESQPKHETKLLIPGLESFYAVAIPLAWPIVRIAVYTLLWGLVCFAIALRGGGPYSVDRRIGIEL
jgi:hypothetical protein